MFLRIHAEHKQRGRSIETIDTWCKYRYLPQLASIDSIDTWYRYRAHPYRTPTVLMQVKTRLINNLKQ